MFGNESSEYLEIMLVKCTFLKAWVSKICNFVMQIIHKYNQVMLLVKLRIILYKDI